jgi:hypothetical protein
MLVVTRVPTHRNDGSKIKQSERRAILTVVRDTFGGYTLEGPFEGAWVADDGRVYEEASYRLEVLVPPERVSEAREVLCSLASESSLANARSTLKFAMPARLSTWIDRSSRECRNEV